MTDRLLLGIMSGTSLDGVDYALCRIGGASLTLQAFWSARFPKDLQETLHAAARGDLETYLRLAPDAADRADIEKRLHALRSYQAGLN